MIASLNGSEYRYSDTHWGKYDSGFHAWLVETCDPDEYDGDTDYGGIALYGRRVDYWTSSGFHSLVTFDTVEEAGADYQEWADSYALATHEHEWGPFEHSRFAGTPHRKCQYEGCEEISLDGDDEEEETCWVHPGAHHAPGSFACEVFSAETWGGTD